MSTEKRKAVATPNPRASTYLALRRQGHTSATIDFLMDYVYSDEEAPEVTR